MNKSYIYILTILCLAACTDKEDLLCPVENPDAVELLGIDAAIYGGESFTRAPILDEEHHVGRKVFVDGDQMIFTTIKRTQSPIDGFSYQGIVYDHAVEDGQKTGGWNRDDTKGSTIASSSLVPERIYWSDAANPHTFIGYSLPQPRESFDWNNRMVYETSEGGSGIEAYYGSIGNPNLQQSADAQNNVINYIDHTTGEKIIEDDLLLTYDTEKVAERGGSVAKIYYHHALACVRVIVNISGFSATETSPDVQTLVSDMVLKNMLTMYRWTQRGYAAEKLDGTYDSDNVSAIYGSESGVTYDQRKDTHLWIPRPAGTGSGVSKTFVFYCLAVPCVMGKNNPTEAELANQLNFEFKVSYPKPINPAERIEKKYTASMTSAVEFRAGHCTTINISLNHSNEEMTVGAEYMEWQYVPTPDQGELKKNSTFLSSIDRSEVTIIGDPKAETIDDATWLYKAKDNNGKDIILDIYGNDGTASRPYTISTANQLLSFAYEVKNGRDFVHQFVKLDADITLQPSYEVTDDKRVEWIGIGDASHVFNGFFLGSGRHINSLYGDHFFYEVGDNAVIDKLNFDNVIEVLGCGVVAHANKGLICGCFIDGDVKETNTSTQYTGSIVGENDSFIIACAHVGKVSGYNTVGGLVGFNNGTVMASYHAGEIVGLGGTTDIHATVGKRGDGTVEGENESIMFSCYYDEELITHEPNLKPNKSGYPLSTSVMQMNAFVNSNKVFLYDETHYTTQGKNLRNVVLEDILKISDEGQTPEQLAALIFGKDGILSPNVWKLFEYHFSLNEALDVFRYWLNAIADAATKEEEEDSYKVVTNCHDFTKEQIQFLQQHYSAEHKFVYVPASYPKVQ